MARPSYGPEAKKRTKRLLEVLLMYAADELGECNESALDALRPQVQIRWQTENRLVVRTKVRFLAALTGLESGQNSLNGEQIKEALKRFEDFLEILEDNRASRGGSETWHFTLKLWYSRWDKEANLRKFDTEWESRRPEKSKLGDKGTRGTRGTRGNCYLVSPIYLVYLVSSLFLSQLATTMPQYPRSTKSKTVNDQSPDKFGWVEF
ncbi:hypothetical protein [Scytonema sp. UIC 10036]|uniref:hypothetical protein n=1 Tax=Scytonema sp. UIC 10036 TaxID=2304196 RepID=UPI00325BAF4B